MTGYVTGIPCQSTKKLIAEAIGTFFLAFTVGTAIASGSTLAPLAIGTALMVMVFAGGHISGAHYNPAVTIAVLVRGRTTGGEAVAYIVAQVAGAVLAGLAVIGVVGERFADAFAPAGAAGAGLAEFLFTFALAWVVLHVATSSGTEGNSYFGLAIGFTVMAGVVAVGDVSGGVFNPAVLVGGVVMNLLDVTTIWYLVVQLLAGVVAALVFRLVVPPTDLAVEPEPEPIPEKLAWTAADGSPRACCRSGTMPPATRSSSAARCRDTTRLAAQPAGHRDRTTRGRRDAAHHRRQPARQR